MKGITDSMLEIKTDRLHLQPFSVKFLTEKYVSWLNNPIVVKYSEQRHKKHTLDSCKTYLSSFKNSPNLFYAICLKESGTHIGNINAYVNTNNLTADMGIVIGETKFWKGGYGTEAWSAMIKYLFHEKRLRKITAGTMSCNIGMLRVMENSGMTVEGVLKRQFLLDGREVDLVKYAIFN